MNSLIKGLRDFLFDKNRLLLGRVCKSKIDLRESRVERGELFEKSIGVDK